MKKIKIAGAFMLLLLLSGCNLPGGTGNEPAPTTNNGTLIFNNETEAAFCSKADIDNYLANAKLDGVVNEFSVTQDEYAATLQELEKTAAGTTNDSCAYTIYSSVATEESDGILITSLNAKKGETFKGSKVLDNEVIEQFINNDDIRVNAVILKYFVKDLNVDDFDDLNLKYSHDGQNDVVLYPVFKFYYLKDKAQVTDYYFSGVSGFRIALK